MLTTPKSPLWHVKSTMSSHAHRPQPPDPADPNVDDMGATPLASLGLATADAVWAEVDDLVDDLTCCVAAPTSQPRTPTALDYDVGTTTATITNVVSVVDLGCPINLMDIALRGRNTQYFPRKQNMVTLARGGAHRSTASVSSSGKVVFMGGTGEVSARISARQHARHLQRLG
eukprot:m.166288 g.166288  ORF g.166288 m.166288 type:complete len:173 (+) comp24037_c0_seq1:150-668(+)